MGFALDHQCSWSERLVAKAAAQLVRACNWLAPFRRRRGRYSGNGLAGSLQPRRNDRQDLRGETGQHGTLRCGGDRPGSRSASEVALSD